jgi:hypothetical protein
MRRGTNKDKEKDKKKNENMYRGQEEKEEEAMARDSKKIYYKPIPRHLARFNEVRFLQKNINFTDS